MKEEKQGLLSLVRKFQRNSKSDQPTEEYNSNTLVQRTASLEGFLYRNNKERSNMCIKEYFVLDKEEMTLKVYKGQTKKLLIQTIHEI